MHDALLHAVSLLHSPPPPDTLTHSAPTHPRIRPTPSFTHPHTYSLAPPLPTLTQSPSPHSLTRPTHQHTHGTLKQEDTEQSDVRIRTRIDCAVFLRRLGADVCTHFHRHRPPSTAHQILPPVSKGASSPPLPSDGDSKGTGPGLRPGATAFGGTSKGPDPTD